MAKDSAVFSWLHPSPSHDDDYYIKQIILVKVA
jgi:hypothetical protein